MEENLDIQSNSYLTFYLGEEFFAASVNNVLSILEMTKITRVPRCPDYMKGVLNLRGTVLPVIDTRLRFGMEEKEYDSNTCILVIEIIEGNEKMTIGAIADGVKEVFEIKEEDILPAPSVGETHFSEYITGVVNKDGEFIMVLDVELLFSTIEKTKLKDIHVAD